MLLHELGEKMEPIRLVPPGTTEVEERQFAQPSHILWRLIAPVDICTLNVLLEEAMHEMRDAILDVDAMIIPATGAKKRLL